MKRIIFLIACAFSLSLCFAQQFTIAVLPDTQVYTDKCVQNSFWFYPLNGMDYFNDQIDYIIENSSSNGGNIDFVLHLGDMIEHCRMFISEWKQASATMLRLNRVVPYLIVPGNHDSDKWSYSYEGLPTQCLGWQTWQKYFGAESNHFKNAEWYGGSYNGGMCSWSVINVWGNQILLIGMELEPTDGAIEWVQKVVDEHLGLPTIIFTHEFLLLGTQAPFCDSQNRKHEGGNSPEYLWNNFIKINPQIFMVLCGHVFSGNEGEGSRIDKNDAGYNVYSLLSNYQGRDEIIKATKGGIRVYDLPSGDGWLRLMTFDLDASSVHVQTYSPTLDRYETDADSDFTINFDFDWKKRFPAANLQYLRTSFMKFVPTF